MRDQPAMLRSTTGARPNTSTGFTGPIAPEKSRLAAGKVILRRTPSLGGIPRQFVRALHAFARCIRFALLIGLVNYGLLSTACREPMKRANVWQGGARPRWFQRFA